MSLTVGGVNFATIAEKFGTPIYAYDLDAITARACFLKKAFAGWDVYYSLKANPCLQIATAIAREGLRCEIASMGEFIFALSAGWEPRDVAYAGPGKRDQEIEATLLRGLGLFHIESPREVSILRRIAKKLSTAQAVSIRLNIEAIHSNAPEQMSASASRFGVGVKDAVEIIGALRNIEQIDLIGLHFYAASGVLDGNEIVTSFLAFLKTVNTIMELTHWEPMQCVFGPGLGIPASHGEKGINIVDVAAIMTREIGRTRLSKCRWAIESGRFIVGPYGVFLTRILDIKRSGNTTFIITDGGINAFSRPAFMKQNHQVLQSPEVFVTTTERVEVGGPTCTPLDILGTALSTEVARVGNVIGIANAGAYGRTMSFTEFLGHDAPGEVVVRHGVPVWARYPVRAEDRLKEQISTPS